MMLAQEQIQWKPVATKAARAAKYSLTATPSGLPEYELTEWLAEAMALRPGARVLDLECGAALSSIFLAREYGVQVWATDAWTRPADNLGRVAQLGLDKRVFPLKAPVYELPFAPGFFDAAVAVGTYHYFGGGGRYIQYLAQFVKPGGRIGIVVPGLVRDLPEDAEAHGQSESAHLAACMQRLRERWHSPAGWRAAWSHAPQVRVETAGLMPSGWRVWLAHQEALAAQGFAGREQVRECLAKDQGRYIGFVRMVATKKGE